RRFSQPRSDCPSARPATYLAPMPALPSSRSLTVQLKLPCATLEAVRARYGPELAQARFTIRTAQPRPAGTLVRLTCILSDGAACFRAGGQVARGGEGGGGWG